MRTSQNGELQPPDLLLFHHSNPQPPSQPPNRAHDPHDVVHTRHIRLPQRRQPARVDRDDRRTRRHALRGAHLQAVLRLPSHISVYGAHGAVQDADLPPKHRLLRTYLFGYLEGEVERDLQRAERAAELAEFAGGAKQVSDTRFHSRGSLRMNIDREPISASPLNGQAAELWDKDPAEYKRLVLARHRDLTDDDEAGDGL